MKKPALPPWARSRTQHNTLSSFGLALAMHAVLFFGMLFVLRWNIQDPAPVVAELWAEPAAPAPTPVVEIPPPPPPPPPPKVEPQPEPPKPDADIVVKEEKKPPPKKEEPKKDLIEDLLKKQEQERVKQEQERVKQEQERVKQEQARAREQAAREARQRAERDAIRQAEADRILQQMQQDHALVGKPQPGTGTSLTDEYRARLIALIRSRIVYAVPESTSRDVYADVQVDLLPSGEVVAIKVLKPSGLPGYDAAVERAIRRTDPFPRRPDGTVDRTITITFRPVETSR